MIISYFEFRLKCSVLHKKGKSSLSIVLKPWNLNMLYASLNKTGYHGEGLFIYFIAYTVILKRL